MKQLKIFRLHINFAKAILINLLYCEEKVFIRMNRWIAGRNLITSLPPKQAFYSKLNLEGITDKDYAHAQKVWEVFEIKYLREYHDLYVQCGTLLLADVFENYRDKCIEI